MMPFTDRMALADAAPGIFDPDAVTAAYGSCDSSLRQLNLILTKALTIGVQNNEQNIDPDIILVWPNGARSFVKTLFFKPFGEP
ncbi:MAG: hypothetical protein NC420_08735 [Eubacterium sp.]|nr:hypothetical protein [Eubacterium sp.]